MPVETLYSEEIGSIRAEVLRFEEIELPDGRIHPSRISVELRIWGPPVLGLQLDEAETLHWLLGEAIAATKPEPTANTGSEGQRE